ncbi:MAG: hypothetical protein V8S98_07280 [Lachnospiraceae bacterium]
MIQIEMVRPNICRLVEQDPSFTFKGDKFSVSGKTGGRQAFKTPVEESGGSHLSCLADELSFLMGI